MYFFDAAVLITCLAGLWFGANLVVDTSVSSARKIGVSELVIGLTIVSIGTSAPEFAVSIFAALKGHGNISVGNVVGSNIFNLGFILGGVALVHPISTSSSIVKRDGSVLVLTTFLLLLLLMDLFLSLWEGVLLISLLIAYILYLLYSRQATGEDISAGSFRWYTPLLLLFGLSVIILSSHFLVDSASSIARALGLSEWVIGVTIVAMGTSTPELVTSLVAVLRGHHGLSAGNLVGSDIFNLLGVLGLAGTLQPMAVSSEAYGSIFLLCLMVIIVVIMMRTGWKITRAEGGALVCLGMVRWILDFT
ncbi:MAG: sodium:calcium antiporter [Deltaproteobacteria bacterium]|nr:sodium:calcium antiporter [Deltaproteobacteria bacterium]